ncbi:phage protease [Xanthomonas sp. CFBP 8445]|uniref:phage protease n=1 Tax=Xanthomonas sp. CFBP 8445 TaxID=2971236 RepID=UPI0021DF64C5|nr:phage protease [Xanthomonas sp. CFBP 8445]UYC12281.1 phage protease [Xanthomonas sp. CFBP 8445]
MSKSTRSSAMSHAIALAACSFTLPAPAEDARTIEIQLTPAGAFKPRDGREMKVPHWYIDQAVASRVIANFAARQNPAVLDYEHQTLRTEENGQPAPAAGWMNSLSWREGSGLWANVELTARAADLIRSGEYRYVSPVLYYDEATGEVLAIEMAAITNNPAIDGMSSLAARAAATFAHHQEKDTMNLLAALLAALGLPESTTEDQAIAACSTLKPKLDTLDKLTTELGAAAPDAALAACSALKTKAAAATPDPAKYVPVAALEDVRTQLAALSAERTAEKVDALVEAGLADGRILPSMKDWASDLGKKDLAALSAYLDKAAPIAALAGTQTRGQPPAGTKDEHGLTAGELAVCSMTGIAPKDYAAAKPATA